MNQAVISEKHLEKLSREELVGLVKVLLAEIVELKARIAELEGKSPPGKTACHVPQLFAAAFARSEDRFQREEIAEASRSQTRTRSRNSSAG